uniref:Uncharacterized protein n=2 Tax=Dunaliella tertiolecta TaxID=3047 RepID=A0A7S3R6U0_DUNTE
MDGALCGQGQQAAAASGGSKTDTGVHGAAPNPWEGRSSGWVHDAANDTQGARTGSGCAVAEGFEHTSGPELHGADASAADVQLDLPDSPRRPFPQQQHQPGFGSGLRHISLPSMSNHSAPNIGSSTNWEQPAGLPPRSSHPQHPRKREELQGSSTIPFGTRSSIPCAPSSNLALNQQQQQQQQQRHQQQQNRPVGPVSPFQIQQPAQLLQGILHIPACLRSSSCQPEGEPRVLQPRASCSSMHSQFLPDNDAPSSADMEHTTKDGAESANVTSRKGNVRFGPTVTSDSSFPFLVHRSERSSISGSGRPSRTKQQDPQQIELVARCNSISEQASLMQRFTKAQTLKLVKSVKDVNSSRDCKDIILIIGDSCFHYLNDLVASIRGVRRSPLAAAVDLARKQRIEEDKKQAKDRFCMQDTIAEEGLREQGTQANLSRSAGQMPAAPSRTWDGARLEQRKEGRERELCKAPIIIMDPVGPNSAQMIHMTELENVSLLLGNPSHPKDLGKLGLTTGSRVRALVLPYVADLDESAVTGYKMSQADAHTLTNCSNLRQYCTLIGANLEIVTEALSFVNVSYLLPLCINGPPYDHGTEEEDPMDNLDSLDSLVRMGSQAHGALPLVHKTSSTQQVFSHRSSMDFGPNSERLAGAPSAPSGPEPSSSKGPRGASEMRLKRKQKHDKVLRPDLGATVLPKHLPSKLRSLAPRQQLNQKVEEYVGRLLADIPALAPALATGHIYTASTVDKLFCMILFSPLLIQIITKMLGVWDCEEIDEGDVDILPYAISLMTKGSQAANQGQSSSGLGQDQLLQREVRRLQLRQQMLSRKREEEQLYSNESIRESPSQRQTDEGHTQEPTSAHKPRIHLVSVACFGSARTVTKLGLQDHVGLPHTWGDLFLSWAPRKLLPIGLYRRDPQTKFPYVYTSPTKATTLRSTDMVYVLASSFDLP